ncbi:Curved DNA-binding protein [Spathaspora sp. JA1]|nr:Curved DNA-binding protein [Spathaspora sp. JA1]
MSTDTKTTAAATPDYTIANGDVVSKYKTAGEISNRVIAQVRSLAIEGSTTYDLSIKGDELMTEELSKIYNSKKTSKTPKGIAFPTCINPNHIPGHLSPISEDDEGNITLHNGDVVNIMLGVQIDGFPAIVAETLIVGESESEPITGVKADLLNSAWKASEAAIRTFTAGKKNWDVTTIVGKVAKEFGTTPVESMLTHNQERNVLYGPKEIILNPTKQNKSSMDTVKFEENDVYGLDILISTSADGKVKPSNYRTSLYKLTGNSYALKMKLSHKIFTEFKQKCNNQPFPFNIRNLQEPKKSRGGLAEPTNHNLLLPYEIVTEREGEFIAQFFTTFAITKNGIVRYTTPSFNAGAYKTDKEIKDEDVLQALAQPLKIKKKTTYNGDIASMVTNSKSGGSLKLKNGQIVYTNNPDSKIQKPTKETSTSNKSKTNGNVSKRKSARIAQMELPNESVIIPQLKPSPDIKQVDTTSTTTETVSGVIYRNGEKVFIEPTLAEPTPIYTGLSLESYPSAKIKKELLWPKPRRGGAKSTSQTASREGSAVPIEQESIEESELERSYREKLTATKLAEDLVQDSQIRENEDKRVLPMRTAKLKLTLKSPKPRPKSKRSMEVSSPVRASKRIKVISPKKSTTSLNISSNLPATTTPDTNEDTKDNDDFCSSCGNPGIFICCENCPKSFHFTCCDPPIEQPPENDWYCRECIAKLHPEKIETHNDIGIFGNLLNNLEITNPSVFQLPRYLREDTFIGVTTGDNGDYSDDSTKPDIPVKLQQQQLEDIETILYDKSGRPYLCHKCGQSGSNNRTLIHCDYCPLIYHIDCLNEPICGPKTIGNKWRCPNHVEDLLPPGYPKLRQFKDCQVIENSLHSQFLKMAAMSNILIKLDQQPYLADPPNLQDYLQFQQFDFETWGEDLNAIHPEYRIPAFLQKNKSTTTGVSSKSRKVFSLTNPVSNRGCSFVYRVPEQSIILDFISKSNTKQDILSKHEEYASQSRLENINQEELDVFDSLNELKSINFTQLLKAVNSEEVEQEQEQQQQPDISREELEDLLAIKKLMQIKGKQALLEFLQS